MKIVFLILTMVSLNFATAFGQCTSLFSFAAYFENVIFINQSNVPNAHFFWNFGDGTGSNFQNPIHKFPETGNYLVTLFAKDTISNCSSYYEIWVNVTKYSLDSCQTGVTDSIFLFNSNYYLKVMDNSSFCNTYIKEADGGPAQNFSSGSWIWLNGGWQHARFISRIQYITNDTINGYVIHREAYKTSPFLYSSSKNYGDCSANFEFKVVSQDSTGQRILFTAMNKTASYYEWEIIGFGNPIVTNNDTISNFYPYNSNNLWLVGLKTSGSSGCKDTLYQSILVYDVPQTIASLNEIDNQIKYNLFPNPFTDVTTLSYPLVKAEATFNLYNINGQLVKTIDNITNGQVTIYRDNLPSGFYFFTIRSDNNTIATGKLIAK